MAGRHPRDEQGRVLPHPWWPADRQAPGELEFVRRFCNSINRENGADRFGSGDALDRWLVSEGAQPVGASAIDLGRVIQLREALHELAVAHLEGSDDSSAWAAFQRSTSGVTFVIDRPDGTIRLAPTGSALEQLIGRIAIDVIEAERAGSFVRLKACRHCHWIVFDPSKNRSSRWCSMTACGGRHNAREYRLRNRSAR
jgi:predicted RNA-binding Zn ribbon-like protein